jgi:hypothetical protein
MPGMVGEKKVVPSKLFWKAGVIMRAHRNCLRAGIALACLVLLCANAQAITTYTGFLTTQSSSETINDALFMPFNPDTATGTGNFESFLRIQGDGTERGYNTGAKKPEFDTKAGAWTHEVVVDSTMPPRVKVGDEWYREILIDLNQTTGGHYLSLDQLVVSLEASANLTGYPSVNYQNFGGPVLYSMDDLAEDSSVIMDSMLFGSGSGKGDVRIYIPDFSADAAYPYLYVYAVFGQQTSVQLPTGETVAAIADSGFEEMGVWVGTPTGVPAPGALLLAALGAGLVARLRRGRLF